MTATPIMNVPKRRDKLVIMAEIIGIAKRGTSKTHIMFEANLSFSQLNQYLNLLLQINLLEKFPCDEKEIYKATEKGLEFLERQGEIINLLNSNTHKNSVKTTFQFNTFPRNKTFSKLNT